MTGINRKPGVIYQALVPNVKGFQSAVCIPINKYRICLAVALWIFLDESWKLTCFRDGMSLFCPAASHINLFLATNHTQASVIQNFYLDNETVCCCKQALFICFNVQHFMHHFVHLYYKNIHSKKVLTWIFKNPDKSRLFFLPNNLIIGFFLSTNYCISIKMSRLLKR